MSNVLKGQRLTKEDLKEIVTWTNVGTERPHFPFIRKPGLNVKIENTEHPLEFFKLFITPEIAELMSRELR